MASGVWLFLMYLNRGGPTVIPCGEHCAHTDWAYCSAAYGYGRTMFEAILRAIIHAEGVPECFCGFEAGRLFLCGNDEVVETAWNFEEICRGHNVYLQHPATNARLLKDVKAFGGLAARARMERRCYRNAFALDPLLPRALWPKHYSGTEVQERHERFRAALQRRFRSLTKRADGLNQ